jgi:hypothetical protein
MDSKTLELLEQWRSTLTDKERQLHELAAVKLKKELVPKDNAKDGDSGSYFAERCHAFLKWRKLNGV